MTADEFSAQLPEGQVAHQTVSISISYAEVEF